MATQELHALVQREKEIESLRDQLAAMKANYEGIKGQPRALLMCLDAELRLMSEHMETLRRSARDHNELIAVCGIDESMARLQKFLLPVHHHNGAED